MKMNKKSKGNKDYRKILDKAFRQEDFELFKQTIKPNDYHNIKKFLQRSIENYVDEFSKFLIEKFDKYEMASQLALEAGDLQSLKLCIEKIGYEKLFVNDDVLKMIKRKIEMEQYDFFEYLLDNTNLLSPSHLTEILCLFVDSTDKIIYFLTKINFRVNLDKLNECALNMGNIVVMNTLVSKGAKPFDEITIQSKVDEKQERELKQKVNYWINRWIDNSENVDKNLSQDMINGLKETIKQDQYTIYRGLTWGKDKMIDNTGIDELKTKDSLKLDLGSYTSWSTNYKVAEFYSKYKVISEGNDYGLILKLTVDKSHVLADLTHKDRDEFYYFKNPWDDFYTAGNQSEIILLPGKYDCKIVQVRIFDKIIKT